MKILNPIKYIVGRSNLALTIFVPYDCPNHCPFCTSKLEYKDTTTFSLGKICDMINEVGPLSPITDIVITGGEPFADLDSLQKILNCCSVLQKHIYINTTLPAKNAAEALNILNFVIKNQDIISGLNISRHMCVKTNLEVDELIETIHRTTKIPLRINSVLLDVKAEEKRVLEFINKYAPIVNSINFRGDYTKIKNQEDLRTLDHPILDILFNEPKLLYLSSGGCLVCNNNDFKGWVKEESRPVYISLHRGYEHSLVVKGNNYIINDLIIKQDGSLLLDWDGQKADLDLLFTNWN